VTDHVGNQTITTSTGPFKVTMTDWTPPAPFDLEPPTNAALPAITTAALTPGCTAIPTYSSATPTLGWTDANDASLSEYRVYFDPAATFPLAYSSVAGTPPASTLTLGARPAGLYWWKVAARDVPNNLTWNNPGLPNPQLQVGIDIAAPTASLTAPADNAWSTSATPTLSWSATDDRCAARTQVWIDDAAEAGAPTAVTSGTESAITTTPLTDGSHLWHVRAIDVADRRTATADRTVRIDTLDPVATATWPAAAVGGSAVAFSGTATDPLRDGSASGVASWRLRYSANVAGPWTTMADPGCTGTTAGPLACTWNSTVVADGNYYFQIEVTDNAGRTHAIASGVTNVDNTPPAISFNSYSPAGGAAANFWTPGGASSTLYYNPAGSGTVAVRFNASDFNGIAGVVYPAIGGGFTAGGAGTGPTPYSYSYTFSPGAPITANHTVTATDGAGRPNTAIFRTEADSDAPVGATIDYLDDYLPGPVPPSTRNSLTFNRGTDFGGAGTGPNRSGLESWVIERAEGDLIAGSCVWGLPAWIVSVTNPAASPVLDPIAMATNKCYQYRIVTTDHVGNTTTTYNAGALKVTKTDWTPPSVFDLQPPTNPALPAITTGPVAPGCTAIPTFTSATPTLDWTDAADSSLAEYRVYFDPTATFPLAHGSVVGAPPVSSLTLGARPAGLYWWKVAARDMPNNLTWNNPGLPNPQLQVGVDIVAPTVSLTTPANNAWSTSATPALSWTATDDRCVARTQPVIDGATADTLTGTASTYTPAALTDGSHTWSVNALDVAARSTSTADRTVRIDTQDPVSSITWPTTPSGGTSVLFAGTAADPLKDGAASGVATWQIRWRAAPAGAWNAVPVCSGITSGAISCNWDSTIVGPDGDYNFRLDVTDAAGRVWTTTSGAIRLDNNPPIVTIPRDSLGADVDAQNSVTSMSANWNAATDPSGVASYDVCFTDSPAGADCAGAAHLPWTSSGLTLNHTQGGLTLVAGSTYYACIRATDNPGNPSLGLCSDGVVADDGPPAAPATVNDGAAADLDYTSSLTTLAGNWSASTDIAGISRYEYCISSTSSSGADCGSGAMVDWTSTGLVRGFTNSTLTLTAASEYWVCVQARDGIGNYSTTSSCSDGITVDRTGPTGVGATFPLDGGTPDEGMYTFDWSAANDPAGVATYSITVDGVLKASSLTPDQWGVMRIPFGAHTWSIRAYDTLGNFTDFPFSFTAQFVPDVTPPDTFNLLTPADGATVPVGTALTWEPAFDFNGISSYKVMIDGGLVGSVAGTVTSFTPGAGSGAPICTVDFDGSGGVPGCVAAPTSAAPWTVGAHSGFNAGGNSLGFDAWDTNKGVTSATTTIAVPATGADLRFTHHFDTSVTRYNDGRLHSAWDGGNVEISTDGGATWASTCETDAKAKLGTSLACTHEVMDAENGYTGVLASGTGTLLPHRHVFAGASSGMVPSTLHLTKFAGQTIQVRFVMAMDGCYVGMSPVLLNECPGLTEDTFGGAAVQNAAWQIDDLKLAEPELTSGPHTWQIIAIDPSGNQRVSDQTWTFVLP
ncbi:MAG: Laminin sub domain 2, partial [Thermoleophilia bacterium]|nr:Laminin sub domain 2 [Thermoleophilia bacterium]